MSSQLSSSCIWNIFMAPGCIIIIIIIIITIIITIILFYNLYMRQKVGNKIGKCYVSFVKILCQVKLILCRFSFKFRNHNLKVILRLLFP
jgi:fumarate reductase subunit D